MSGKHFGVHSVTMSTREMISHNQPNLHISCKASRESLEKKISGLSHTDDNYCIALESLRDRYADPITTIRSPHPEIFQLAISLPQC